MTTPKPPVTRFDHITIIGDNVTNAAECYARLFGEGPRWTGHHPELGTRSALFALENGVVEITAPDTRGDADNASALREHIAQAGPGLWALAFGTDDADECTRTLRGRELRVTPPQAGEAHGDDGTTRHYRSIDISPRASRGVPVLIVERGDFDSLRATSSPAADQVHALDHVVIRTADVQAAKRFYGDQLGLRLALDREFGGVRMLFFRVGGVTIEIVEDAALGTNDALHGAAYRVRDLHAAHRRMSEVGIDVGEIRAGNKAQTHVYTVRDGTLGVPTLILHDPARP